MSASVGESITLTWDYSNIMNVHDIALTTYIVTPRSGRVRSKYYYDYWLEDNKLISSKILGNAENDSLYRKTIAIENVTEQDSGMYAVELTLSTSWINITQTSRTTLLVTGK